VDLKREIAYTRQDARLAESCAGGAHAGDLSHLTSPASFGLKKTVAFFAFPASLALKIVLFLFLFSCQTSYSSVAIKTQRAACGAAEAAANAASR
jgi:hypothetical protein